MNSKTYDMAKALEPLEKAEAKVREMQGKTSDGKAGGRGRKKAERPSGKLPEGLGQSRDKVAGAVGMRRSD